MHATRKRNFKLFLCIIIAVAVLKLAYIVSFSIPSSILMLEGEEYHYNASKIIYGEGSEGLCAEGNAIMATAQGEYELSLTFAGILPVKTVQVSVLPQMGVIPSGQTIGVKIDINGVMVVAITDIRDTAGKKHTPAKSSGLKIGDVVKTIGNQTISKSSEFVSMIEASGGNPLEMIVNRKGKDIKIKITPILEEISGTYKVGTWVRDSSTGIGTMTFVDPETGNFGALGHGITDADTGQIVTVGGGSIVESRITSIRKGERGNPGELKGMFIDRDDNDTTVVTNCKFGIYGSLGNTEKPNRDIIPIASKDQVHEGAAYILANVEGDKVEQFEIKIEKVSPRASDTNKSLVVRVTDPALISKTGGIVQGMSGSPIIQDDKLVGAITHVYVVCCTKKIHKQLLILKGHFAPFLNLYYDLK